MAIEFDTSRPEEQWDRVASELRAHKQTQQQAWGDIDNATLGRYLADDLTVDERQQIEQALTQLPELRKLTDIVRDVLDEFDPAAPVPVPATPKVLPFPPPRSANKLFRRTLRRNGALLVAASLLLGLGLTLGGMHLFTNPDRNNGQTNLGPAYAELQDGREKGDPPTPDKNDESLRAKQPNEKEMIEGWKQLGTSLTSFVANSQEQLGEYHQKNGDYDRAAAFLSTAHDLRRKTQGDKDPDTLKTSQNLANVYQVALNTPPAPERPPIRATANHPFVPIYLGLPGASMPLMMAKRDPAYEKACALRDRIIKQNPEEVKQTIVPLLVQGFRSAKTSVERQAYARALGTLGPASAAAITDLKTALEDKETPNDERAVLAWTLSQFGPTHRTRVSVGTIGGSLAEATLPR